MKIQQDHANANNEIGELENENDDDDISYVEQFDNELLEDDDDDLSTDTGIDILDNDMDMKILKNTAGESESENETTPLLNGNNSSSNYNSNDPGNFGTDTAKKSQQDLQESPFTVETSKIGIFAMLTFQWLVPLLRLGNSKEQLNPEDLRTLPLPPSCETNNVSKLFEYYWSLETQTSNKGDVSMARCLAKAYGPDFLRAGLLKLVHDLNVFVGPIVLNQLIQFLRDPNAPLSTGLLLTMAVTISQTIMSFALRHYFFKCYLTGLRLRTAIVVAVYKKSLKLSSAERQRRSTGEIINFMTVDAQRIQDLTTYLHVMWYSVIQIGLSIYFLWKQLGPSCLGGVTVIVIMVPVNKKIASWMLNLQKVLMKCRDDRVEVNNEVLGNMKVIKLQAWEGSYKAKILKLRNAELKQLTRYIVVNAIQIMMWTAVPLVVALASFATYTLLGNTLDVATALTSLALFDILRFPLSMLPKVVNNLVEATISLKRVKDFLLSEDHVPVNSTVLSSSGEELDMGVHIQNGTFIYDSKKPKLDVYDIRDSLGMGSKKELSETDQELMKQLLEGQWEIRLLKAQLKDAEKRIISLTEKENYGSTQVDTNDEHIGVSMNSLTIHSNDVKDENESPVAGLEEEVNPSDLLALRRIDFSCGRGELIAVVGLVGSGKTTFINSLLGEVKALSGTLAVKGRLAYFPQTPFIMNDTLQRNVTFARQSEAFDKNRYDLALSICALEHDIKLLSDGDQTEIGEKGITLSGGQKARVAMARAVYHDADIYLLDDPLAAVDAHVGKHVFQKCIVDELLFRKTSCSDSSVNSRRQSSVILVTNAIQYLSNPNVSKIIVLDEGSIAEVGTYNELCGNPNSLFSSFVSILDETSDQSTARKNNLEPLQKKVENGSSKLSFVQKLGTQFSSIPSLLRPVVKTSTDSDNIGGKSDTKIGRNVQTDAEERQNLTNNIKPGGYKNSTAPLMTSELQEREKGHVTLEVYLAWFKAAGGALVGSLIFVAYVVDRGADVGSNWWLTYWSSHGDENQVMFLQIYALVNAIAILTMLGRVLLVLLSGLNAAKLLFAELLDAILRAPMSFFDTTPIGRILNRFSKDLYILDEKIALTFQSYLATLSTVLSTIFVISFVTPYFTLCLIPMSIFYINQQRFFTRTYRELKRLDSVSRSPLYALLQETLDGVSTIRAFKAESALVTRLTEILDENQNAYFLITTSQCWLAIRLEMVGTLIIFCACIFIVLEHSSQAGNEAFAGLAGLSISYALSVTQSMNWSVRMSSDLDAHMVSVERIKQYCRIASEAPRTTAIDDTLVNWPSNGEITFSSVKLRYRRNLPLVLKGLDIHIPAMSKVGVVGRTGAGKSTLVVSLLRLVELAGGSIDIDGVDISKVGLELLRSKISVIPQDPVLFAGTIRSNLDPFMIYTDDRLKEVLQRVGMMGGNVERVPSNHSLTSFSGQNKSMVIKSLDNEVLEGGSNFSVGQRQLLVIARALLCGAKIVIMDEATASVDAETDARIQRVMRSEFKSSTCITVAHRINTIFDSDYVLVMDDGRAAEFDSPDNLLRQGGLFKDLCDAWEKEHRSVED